MYVNRKYYTEEGYEYLEDDFGIKELATSEFELIEESIIDIDNIEELKTVGITVNENGMTININEVEKINEVIRGLKHLNKEIQSIKK